MGKGSDWSALVAAELGHEVRNVLTIVESLGSLLLEELPPTSDSAQLVDDLLHTAERAKRLSQRLMQLANERLSDTPADLVAVIGCQSGTLRRVAPDGVTVAVAIAAGPLRTRLSALDVAQVVFNLAHNAFDAMTAGGTLAIDVSAAPNTAVITVRDTGAGMDVETRRRCFEPFFTTKGEAGTGLGLHSVRATVERVGGRLTVDSEPGRGTTFAVYLPLLETGAAS